MAFIKIKGWKYEYQVPIIDAERIKEVWENPKIPYYHKITIGDSIVFQKGDIRLISFDDAPTASERKQEFSREDFKTFADEWDAWCAANPGKRTFQEFAIAKGAIEMREYKGSRNIYVLNPNLYTELCRAWSAYGAYHAKREREDETPERKTQMNNMLDEVRKYLEEKVFVKK